MMIMGGDPKECPYVGLEPFESRHRRYFFGRDRDIRIIADHVLARPVVVLYGPSGVGKSSVLNVGLTSELPRLSGWTIVRLRDWQDQTRLEALAVAELLRELPDKPRRPSQRLRFAPLILWGSRRTRRPILLILDQFEEYFLYRDPQVTREAELALATLLERSDIPVHILISLRDDALHNLDMLRGVIPGILDTTVQLGHLRDSDVEEAIRKPIARYNDDYRRDGKPIVIEDGLAATLIRQLKEAETGFGKGRAVTAAERRIELPYLQLALTKLWEAEGGMNATVLHEATLSAPDKLGGVQKIVRSHVNSVMSSLTDKEQELCARIFDRLVTGIGSKVAYPTDALAAEEVVGPGIAPDTVAAVLQKLTPKEARILKPVTTAGMPAFEVFHDVLGLPVLEWKRTFVAQLDKKRTLKARLETSRIAFAIYMMCLFVGFGASYLTYESVLYDLQVFLRGTVGVRIPPSFAAWFAGSLVEMISSLVAYFLTVKSDLVQFRPNVTRLMLWLPAVLLTAFAAVWIHVSLLTAFYFRVVVSSMVRQFPKFRDDSD
jgi:hypothetical protein